MLWRARPCSRRPRNGRIPGVPCVNAWAQRALATRGAAEGLTRAAPRGSLEDIKLRERSQTQTARRESVGTKCPKRPERAKRTNRKIGGGARAGGGGRGSAGRWRALPRRAMQLGGHDGCTACERADHHRTVQLKMVKMVNFNEDFILMRGTPQKRKKQVYSIHVSEDWILLRCQLSSNRSIDLTQSQS